MQMFPLFALFVSGVLSQSAKVILTNDDGWAVAQIRAQRDTLVAAGFNVVLSAPAENESGTGSSSATPNPLSQPCEFNTCPTGSPAEGFNASDTRLNYVNFFPVDTVRYGFQTLAPQYFGSGREFVVSGPNVGTNLGSGITGSGTVGAACEAALEGIPSVAVSATPNSQVSYTTTTSNPSSTSTLASLLYAQLTVTLATALYAPAVRVILPPGITLNVNYLSTSGYSTASAFKFVLTRLVTNSSAVDVQTCGSTRLPVETTVVNNQRVFCERDGD